MDGESNDRVESINQLMTDRWQVTMTMGWAPTNVNERMFCQQHDFQIYKIRLEVYSDVFPSHKYYNHLRVHYRQMCEKGNPMIWKAYYMI